MWNPRTTAMPVPEVLELSRIDEQPLDVVKNDEELDEADGLTSIEASSQQRKHLKRPGGQEPTRPNPKAKGKASTSGSVSSSSQALAPCELLAESPRDEMGPDPSSSDSSSSSSSSSSSKDSDSD